MNKTAITVVIPLYNKESSIERSVQSVLSQSFKNFELIIVDDGSTDGSAAVVERFNDERIRLIHQENGGPSKARNTGVEHACGEWIVFLDADDELLPGALETFERHTNEHLVANLIDCGRIIRTGNHDIRILDKEDGIIEDNFKAWFYNKIAPGCGSTIYKRELVKKYPYPEHIRRYEDAEFLFRILKESKVYSAKDVVEVHNNDYAAASKVRRNITDDFIGHLYMKGLGFWERMCMYRIYLMERENYPDDVRRLYPTWRYRYDLLLIYKLLLKFGQK